MPGFGSNDAIHREMSDFLKIHGGMLRIYSRDPIQVQWIVGRFRIGVKIVGRVGEEMTPIVGIERFLRLFHPIAATPIAYCGGQVVAAVCAPLACACAAQATGNEVPVESRAQNRSSADPSKRRDLR